jgi:hypothetical protein
MTTGLQLTSDPGFLPGSFRELAPYVRELSCEFVRFEFPSEMRIEIDARKIRKHFKKFSVQGSTVNPRGLKCYFKKEIKLKDDVDAIIFMKGFSFWNGGQYSITHPNGFYFKRPESKKKKSTHDKRQRSSNWDVHATGGIDNFFYFSRRDFEFDWDTP